MNDGAVTQAESVLVHWKADLTLAIRTTLSPQLHP